MKFYLAPLSVFVAFLFFGSVPASAHAAAALPDTSLRSIIENGVSWLENAQEPNGHFRYEYLPYENSYRDDDNIVRQAGALFQMGEIERMDTKNIYTLRVSMQKSIDYFALLSVPGEYNGKKFRCIKEKGYPYCKLGTTALAAIGLSDFLKAYPSYEKVYGPLLADYNAYILAMKKKDAGFHYYFKPEAKVQKDDESSFSNGEAFFALVRAYERKPSAEVRDVIDDTFSYLDAEVPFDSALYLWAMAGVRDLNLMTPDPVYVSYAHRYTLWRLADNARYVSSTKNRCPYIEGLASADTILEGKKYIPGLRGTIDAMLTETASLQVRSVNMYRYIMDEDGARIAKLADEKRAIGGFLTGHASVDLSQRIDFTQHCLSAYAQTLVDIRGKAF